MLFFFFVTFFRCNHGKAPFLHHHLGRLNILDYFFFPGNPNFNNRKSNKVGVKRPMLGKRVCFSTTRFVRDFSESKVHINEFQEKIAWLFGMFSFGMKVLHTTQLHLGINLYIINKLNYKDELEPEAISSDSWKVIRKKPQAIRMMLMQNQPLCCKKTPHDFESGSFHIISSAFLQSP